MAFVLPMLGFAFAVLSFAVPDANPLGVAIVGGAVFLVSVILGCGFAIGALSNSEKPKWLAVSALAMNSSVILVCIIRVFAA